MSFVQWPAAAVVGDVVTLDVGVADGYVAVVVVAVDAVLEVASAQC